MKSANSLSRLLLPAVVLSIAIAAGCVQETRSGDGVKYTYALWAPLSIIAASVAGVGGGWFMRGTTERYS
jgi:hypothetical protein